MEVKSKKEEGKEVKKDLFCEKCGSPNGYALINGTFVCRRCAHKTLPKK